MKFQLRCVVIEKSQYHKMMKNHENDDYRSKGDILWSQKNYDAERKLVGFFYHKS